MNAKAVVINSSRLKGIAVFSAPTEVSPVHPNRRDLLLEALAGLLRLLRGFGRQRIVLCGQAGVDWNTLCDGREYYDT